METPKSKWPETLEKVREFLVANFPDDDTDSKLLEFYEHIVGNGGMPVYFPKIDKIRSYLRDKEIVKSFNGHNHRELSQKHGLTTQHVRSICDRKR